jgi:hypothetical protein
LFTGNFPDVNFVHLKTVGWCNEVASPCKTEMGKIFMPVQTQIALTPSSAPVWMLTGWVWQAV